MAKLLTTDQAAEYLGLAANTLAKKRCEGTAPVFVRLGRNGSVRYRLHDLNAWLVEASSTSQRTAA
jgi:predicted DNA-binding transcriptional regulator AlpA